MGERGSGGGCGHRVHPDVGWKQAHPEVDSEKMSLQKQNLLGSRPQDAVEDYLESGSKASELCLRDGACRWRTDRGRTPAPKEQQSDLFRVQASGSRLRHPRSTSLRVCSVVEPEGLLPLRAAPGGLPTLWRESGTASMVGRQTSTHPSLCLVLGHVGEADELERGRRAVSHELGACVPLGRDGRRV